jgi:hypothetical protein
MSNVTVPVVQILRRLFNVVSASALALSQQYNSLKPSYFTNTGESQKIEADRLVRESGSANHAALPSYPPRQQPRTEPTRELSPIEQLLINPTLFDPVRKPRYPIVLCHGTIVVVLTTLCMWRS